MATAGKTVGFKDKDYVDNEFIDILSAPDEEYLKGDGTWATAAEIVGVGLLLDTLGDVTLTSPADDDFLIYDTATSLWKNKASSTIPASIGLGSSDSVDFDNLTLTGNLVVGGTRTIINTEVLGVVDPIITLQTAADGGPLTVDSNKDVGLGLQYFDGSAKTAFIGFDDSELKLTFVPDATITNEVVTGAKGTIVADLEGTITAQGDTELYALSQVTSAANKGIQFTGSGTAATYDLTIAGKALLDDADAATQRLTLGLGSVATHSLSSVIAMTASQVPGYLQHLDPASVSILKSGLGTIATHSLSSVLGLLGEPRLPNYVTPTTRNILKFGLGTIATHSLSSVLSMMSSTKSLSGMKDIDITGVYTDDIIVYDGTRWVNQKPPNAAGLRALGLGTIATHSLSSVLALLGEPRLPNYISPTTRNILKTGLGTIATHSLSSVVAMMSSTQSISGMKDIDITNATTNDIIVYDGIRWVNQTAPTARLSLGLGTIATHSLSSVLGLIGEPRLPNYISPTTERILRQGLGTIATKSFASVLSSFDHNTSLKGLQDTVIDSATLADNDFLIFNSADSKWYNRSTATSRTKMGVAIGTDVFAQPSATGSLPLPVGTTAQQAGSQGGIRYNTTTPGFEGYDGSAWGALGGAAGGASEINEVETGTVDLDGTYNETIMIADVFNVVGSVVLTADFYMSKISDDGTNVTLTGSGSITGSGTMGPSFPFMTGTAAEIRSQLGLGTIATHSLSSILALAKSKGLSNAEVISLINETVTLPTDFVSKASGGTFSGAVSVHANLNTYNVLPVTNTTYDIGASGNKYNNVYATTFQGTATSANWSDLAERYEADKYYDEGTVLAIGGEKEVTEYVKGMPFAGVVSIHPGLRMNDRPEYEDDPNFPYICLTGRIPVKINGTAKKGDYIITDDAGRGKSIGKQPNVNIMHDLIGIALSNSNSEFVEVKI